MLALAVPSLAEGGGVPAVARFVKNVVLRSGRFDLMLVSLSTSSKDSASSRLTTPSSWRRGGNTEPGTWDGLPYVHVGAMLGEFEFQRYRQRAALTRILGDCDLIQVVSGSPAWANAVVGLGKPVALQVATRARIERRRRDSRPYSMSGWWRKAMTAITDRMDDCALCRVDAIQVENPWMLDYARELNVGRKVDIRYAPPGVDVELFRPLAARSLQADPYILCVGRLSDPRKNIGLLLEAYALLPASVRNRVRLVLAGSSAPLADFWQRAEALGLRRQISYIQSPDVEALVHIYQRASVFALPSDEEGLGMVVLEAMACGVPVVSTCSGGPDGIITDEEDGYLVPLDEPAALSLRLERLLDDDALNIRMGRAARQTVDRRYDEHVAGRTFLEMWDRLLAKS